MIPSYDLLTIGHSNLAADRFMALLKSARVSAIADVRSVPFSRWCPWFSSKALAQRLAEEGIVYIPLGDALGAPVEFLSATEIARRFGPRGFRQSRQPIEHQSSHWPRRMFASTG